MFDVNHPNDVFNSSDSIKNFEEFFKGSYSYHWHNNWNTPILKDSWMDIINEEFNNFLEKKKSNIYGEWNQV